MKHFKYYSKQDLNYLTKLRRFETKVGEMIQVIDDQNNLEKSLNDTISKYALIGIPEDIGVRANMGVGGTDTAWLPFLQSFLNIQSNDFLLGDEVLIMGHFDFGDVQFLIDKNAQDESEKLEAYRHAVNTIDDEVEGLIKLVTAAQKIPIVVGGGHNNAYPLIKGTAKGLHKAGLIPLAQINCINLDAHTDYRPLEGRHSGNAFRYAEEDGYLAKYCVIGMHENYIPQNVWVDIVNNPFIDCITFEDIFIHEKRTFLQAVAHAANFTEDNFTGIELDLDSIANALASASTPSGITPQHARQFANFTGMEKRTAYFHICEGAARLINGRMDEGIGKLISYLVSDFIKASEEVQSQ
jgi:formiminoglutamase